MTMTDNSISPSLSSTTPSAPAPDKPSKPAAKVWDIILTIALVLVGWTVIGVLVIGGALLGFAGDSCGEISCSFTQIGIGIIVAVFAPVIVFLIATVLAIVALVRRKLAWWIPLVGVVLAILAWVAGFLMVSTAVDGFYN